MEYFCQIFVRNISLEYLQSITGRNEHLCRIIALNICVEYLDFNTGHNEYLCRIITPNIFMPMICYLFMAFHRIFLRNI